MVCFSTDSMDFSSMTLTQIKRQEMDSQVGDSHVLRNTPSRVSLGLPGVGHQIWGHHAQLLPGSTSKGKAQGVKVTR